MQNQLVFSTDKIRAWVVSDNPPEIVSGKVSRDWMDNTSERYAYRCLPMNIANQLGWDILNPHDFVATWNGSDAVNSIKIDFTEKPKSLYALDHFGHGVLTFSMGHLFETPPGINLLVKGSPNYLFDGIQALEGVVETDWSYATFTMNWKFTSKNKPVHFKKGVPICRIIPIPRYLTEMMIPEVLPISYNPELKDKNEAWSRSRSDFNRGLKDPNSPAVKQKWQKTYFLGEKGSSQHQTKLAQSEFVDKTKKVDGYNTRPVVINMGKGTAVINIKDLRILEDDKTRIYDTPLVKSSVEGRLTAYSEGRDANPPQII